MVSSGDPQEPQGRAIVREIRLFRHRYECNTPPVGFVLAHHVGIGAASKSRFNPQRYLQLTPGDENAFVSCVPQPFVQPVGTRNVVEVLEQGRTLLIGRTCWPEVVEQGCLGGSRSVLQV